MRPRIKVTSIRVTNSPVDLTSLRYNERSSVPAIVRLSGAKSVKIPYNVGVLALSDIAHFQDLIRSCVNSLKKVKPLTK